MNSYSKVRTKADIREYSIKKHLADHYNYIAHGPPSHTHDPYTIPYIAVRSQNGGMGMGGMGMGMMNPMMGGMGGMGMMNPMMGGMGMGGMGMMDPMMMGGMGMGGMGMGGMGMMNPMMGGMGMMNPMMMGGMGSYGMLGGGLGSGAYGVGIPSPFPYTSSTWFSPWIQQLMYRTPWYT
ncbi:uncharacterized protein L199_000693 [Kwoniella botswanensis]|uniref:uncharacterized protein n=1 Tax=Kwoniella botswanensis TaxID=1268659 RepID=UPI00315CFA94